MTVAQQALRRPDEAGVNVDRTVAIREILDLAVALDHEESVVDALLALGATENEIVVAAFDLR
jgi:cytochrome c-type biogenesis protein CcmH/NrfG